MGSHVAIVCDNLTEPNHLTMVLDSLHSIFPKATIYTFQYDAQNQPLGWLKDANINAHTSKTFPKNTYHLIRLRQKYFASLDLSSYDIVISVTDAEAKFIKKGNATHICYCSSPTKKYWQHYDDFIADPGFGALNDIVRFFFKILIKPLRRSDFKAAQSPDYFITTSTYAAEQIKKYYKRESVIIAPPVAVEKFSTRKLSTGNNAINNTKSQAQNITNNKTKTIKRQGYISASCQLACKRLDLAVKACKKLNEPLILIGDGPEHERLKKFVGNNPLVTFLPAMNQESLRYYLSQARGYLLPSLELFDTTSVEALASGCPVIAYGKGGVVDYVINGENGVLFERQTVDSLVAAMQKLKTKKIPEEQILHTALPFSKSVFQAKLKEFLRKII